MSQKSEEVMTHLSVDQLTEEIENIDLISDTSKIESYCSEKKNEISCEAKNKYSKLSFDRFGDDLTELIISYLPIKEKFRFECLSKRIQSLIFNKQAKLILTSDQTETNRIRIRNTIRVNNPMIGINKRLESVLIKMNALTNIEIIGDTFVSPYGIDLNEVLLLLANNCRHLNSLVILNISISNVSDQTITYFGQRCGNKIKELSVFCQPWHGMVNQLLSWMTNLESLKTFSMSSILIDHQKWKVMKTSDKLSPKLPKLKTALFTGFSVENNLEQFAEEYPNIQLITTLHTLEGIPFQYLTSLHNLTADLVFVEPRSFQLMAKHCPNLRILEINFRYSNAMEGILRVVGQLTHLQTLMISANREPLEHNNYGSVADLKAITGLKCLSLTLDMNDQNLNDIDKHLPDLRVFSVGIIGRMSEKTLKSISRLEDLIAIVIELSTMSAAQKMMTDSDVIYLLENNHRLRRIDLIDKEYKNRSLIEITVESINSFAKKAKLNPKIDYYFRIKCSKRNNPFRGLHSIPPNLYISNYNW